MISSEPKRVIRGAVSVEMSPGLAAIQAEAKDLGIAVISDDAIELIRVLMEAKKPLRILEIGCAVGFSAALFSEFSTAGIVTIERYPYMIERAKRNFERLGLADRVTLLIGDASDILPRLNECYDFIFMDAGKAQYIRFLPDCLRLLSVGGILTADDVLLYGQLTRSRTEVPRRQRTAHRRMNAFLDELWRNEELMTVLFPIGHGLTVSVKI